MEQTGACIKTNEQDKVLFVYYWKEIDLYHSPRSRIDAI